MRPAAGIPVHRPGPPQRHAGNSVRSNADSLYSRRTDRGNSRREGGRQAARDPHRSRTDPRIAQSSRTTGRTGRAAEGAIRFTGRRINAFAQAGAPDRTLSSCPRCRSRGHFRQSAADSGRRRSARTLRARPRGTAGNSEKRSAAMNEASDPSPTIATEAGMPGPDERPPPTDTACDREVEIFASGLNGALNRLPKVHYVNLPVGVAEAANFQWRPHWPRVKTISLTFPAGLEFQIGRASCREEV